MKDINDFTKDELIYDLLTLNPITRIIGLGNKNRVLITKMIIQRAKRLRELEKNS